MPCRRRRLFFVGIHRSAAPEGHVPRPLVFLPSPLTLSDVLDLGEPNLNGIGSLSTTKRRVNVAQLLLAVASDKKKAILESHALPRFACMDIDRSPSGRVFDKVLLYDMVLHSRGSGLGSSSSRHPVLEFLFYY